ncbi:MAG: putative lipopolysaccharide heptosyltransferase III [Gammaproteobacteria bacterium]|nr:MAG: putative lipopolysaccharide heptosyltransferase III [Gammaproteobacteria bacterium]
MKDAIDPTSLKRVLVIKLRHHGDVLLASPVLTALKHVAPQAHIDALVYQETAPMLEGHPALNQLHVIDRAWRRQGPVAHLKAEWALIQRLRACDYDLVIHLTEHWRGVILTRFIQPRYAVAGRYTRRANSRLWARTFTHTYPLLPRRHTVQLHLDALRRIGIRPDPMPGLEIRIPESAHQSVRDKLADAGLTTSTPYIVVHPTSRWMFKGWPPEHFSEIVDSLEARGMRVVLSAAPTGRELSFIERVLEQSTEKPVNLAGQLSLKELAALIEGARAFVGLDSVPMHLAAATRTPAVALFGPSSEVEWGPWQSPARVLTLPFSCRPCGQDGCGGGKISECLWQITPEQVVRALEELLEIRP